MPLSVIVSVDSDVLARQVAGIAEIAVLTDTKVNFHMPFPGLHLFTYRSRIKISRPAVFINKAADNFAREFVGIEFRGRVADGADDPAPVGITPVKSTADQRTIDNRPNCGIICPARGEYPADWTDRGNPMDLPESPMDMPETPMEQPEARSHRPEEPPVKFSRKQYDMLLACSEKQDVSEWNELREKNPEVPIHLEGARFHRAHLVGVNLEGAHLKTADFTEARLTDSNFRNARLRGAIFWSADLDNARMTGCELSFGNLEIANLAGAVLKGAKLSFANFRGACLKHANLTGTDLCDANMQGAGLDEADLQGADLQRADLQDAYLRKAKLQGVDLRLANMQRADLTGASLQGARLRRTSM